jgi:predicted phage terminase large subunit-like protein
MSKDGKPAGISLSQALRGGWQRDTDFVVNERGKVVSLVANRARECPRCNVVKPATQFHSGLHHTCRPCGSDVIPKVLDAPAAPEPPKRAAEPPIVPGIAKMAPGVALAAMQRELAARTLARRRLIPFIERFHPGYKAGWVHKDICRRLERFLELVKAGASPRLLVFCPPRLGKSLIASQHFPAWALGHCPEFEIIAASYNVSLPTGFSRRIRETLRDPVYQAMFDETRLSDESQAVEAWRTTAGGGYVAAGVGTGITGKGAHIFIIDDPIKDMEAADSVVIRDGTWEWWNSTAYTRIAPGGGVLGIQTRWNDDDWAGRILVAMSTGEGDQYEVCSYPAINEEGDEYLMADDTIAQVADGIEPPEGAQLLRAKNSALHPERYDIKHLQQIKRNLIASGQRRVWSALYQQNPVPDEGAFFRKDMFRFVATPPPRAEGRIFQAWDFSITEKETSDWIVGVTLMQDEHDNVYEMDMMRFKVDEDSIALADAILDFYDRWKCYLAGFEDGQIFKSMKAILLRRAQERRIALNYETLTPLTDKLVRAGPLRGRMQMGKLFMNQSAPYRETVDNELLRFPGGKHDDIVDAYAWCMRLILAHQPVVAPHHRAEKRRREKTVQEKLRSYHRGATTHMCA